MRFQCPATKIEVGHTYQALDSRRVVLKVLEINPIDNQCFRVEVIHPGTGSEIIGSNIIYYMISYNWTEEIHRLDEDVYDVLERKLSLK